MIKVTDAMTEAALRQWYGPEVRVADFRGANRKWMQAAIEAALKAAEKEKAAEVSK